MTDSSDNGVTDRNPQHWLSRAVEQHGEQPGLYWRQHRWRFSELETQTHKMAAQITRLSLPPAVMALQARDPRQSALALYAALTLPRPLLLLKNAWSREQCQNICKQAAPSVLLSGDADSEASFEVRADYSADSQVPPAIELDALRLLVATSGSNGQPKLVMLNDRQLAAAVAASKTRIPVRPGDIWLACMPLIHIGGLSILLRCLEAAAAVWLHEGFDAELVWRALHRRRVTHVSLVPAMLHRLLEVSGGRKPPDSLRCLLIGGGALDPRLAKRAQQAGWPLCVTYGMSETGSQIATDCSEQAGLNAGAIGPPLPGFEVRRRDGVIEVRGPALMAGYASPGLKPGLGLRDAWLRTGDIGRLDEAGTLWIYGRSDDLLLSAGEKVHPFEVEPTLRQAPQVEDAALSAIADPIWGERLVAVYSGRASGEALDAYCRDRLEGARRPRHFLRVAELPYAALSKLDRKALRRIVAQSLRHIHPRLPT
jgi:O-succinylbenzoic acid--CoA ligase